MHKLWSFWGIQKIYFSGIFYPFTYTQNAPLLLSFAPYFLVVDKFMLYVKRVFTDVYSNLYGKKFKFNVYFIVFSGTFCSKHDFWCIFCKILLKIYTPSISKALQGNFWNYFHIYYIENMLNWITGEYYNNIWQFAN